MKPTPKAQFPARLALDEALQVLPARLRQLVEVLRMLPPESYACFDCEKLLITAGRVEIDLAFTIRANPVKPKPKATP